MFGEGTDAQGGNDRDNGDPGVSDRGSVVDALRDEIRLIDTLGAQVVELSARVDNLTTNLADPNTAIPLALAATLAADLSAATTRLRRAVDVITVTAATATINHAVHHRDGMRSERAWLATHTGISRNEANRLARALAHVINVLDPDVIVLGGGMSNVDELYDLVPGQLPRYVFGGEAATPVVRNRHGDSSGVRGAAWLWPKA